MAGQTVPVKSWILLFIMVISTSWANNKNNNNHHEAPNFEAAFQGKCGPKSPCVQLCVELHDGTFECQCRDGFRLLQDGYSCVEALNTSVSDEDSEEEWIRTNSIQNRLIHEHHDQQRDLQLNNYRRSQAAAAVAAASSSRLSYYPFSGKSSDEVTTSASATATTSSSDALRPEQNSVLEDYSSHNNKNRKLVYNSVNGQREGKLMKGRKIQATPFSFASKFTFDSHELPTLYGRPNNDEKIREALLLTSRERDRNEDDSGEENDDDDESSEEEDDDDTAEEEEEEEEDDEDEDDDDVEIDQIFQNNLKFLKDKIESERKRGRLLEAEGDDAPTITHNRLKQSDGGYDQNNIIPVDEDAAATVGTKRGRDQLNNMNSNFDLAQSDDASVISRPAWSSSSEEGKEKVGQVPSVSTTSFPSTTSTTTQATSISTSSSSSSSAKPSLSSSPSSPEEEQIEAEETAAGTDIMTTSESEQINQKCSLQCKNGGMCSWDGRFTSSGNSDDSKTRDDSAPAAGAGTDEQSLEEKLAGYRCLCPMGYSGSFCEIEDGSAASSSSSSSDAESGGYDSGLFRGQSWVAFPVLHDAYMSDQISLEFRPETPNGILLVTGERDDLSGDFLALYVRDGYLEFRFDCGSGSGMVRSSQPVNLQQWNRASIVRRRWEGWMQLNDGPFTQGRSKGLFSRITFRQPVFIGGAGNITFGSISPSFLSGENDGNVGSVSNGGSDMKNKIEESELETEGPTTEEISSSMSSSSSASSSTGGNGAGEGGYMKINESRINSSVNQVEDLTTTSLPILRKIGGFRGCIRNLIINERTYRFGLEPAGDALQGFDIENCNDQGVCDLVNCQHGGQCIVQKDENPTCLCPLGYAGHFCETPLDLQIPSFNGSSYLKYGGLGLSRVLSWLELEIIVKPDTMDGLILYNGYKTDGMGDFISLVIDQGYFEFAMDLGTGTAILRSDYPVALSEWHRILISRTSRLISMRIDNQSPLMALTPGAFTQLSLPHNLFLGGIPDPQWLSPKVKVHTGFSGCIQKLVINGKPLRIMGSAMSGVNLENCAHPCLRNPCDHGGECVPEMDSFKCHCPLGYRDSYCQSRMDKQDVITAPKLIGDSYLKFTHPRIIKRISGSRLNLSFRIRTSLSRGLILWAGRKLMTSASDFISVALRNGFVHASFSLGSGQTTIAYNYTAVHDGQWHLVRLVRNEQEASLYIDDGPPVIGVAPGKLRQLNINDGLYIGGLDDPRHQSLNKYSEGLVGCITDLILGNDYRVALLQDASEGRNVDYCD